MAQTAKGPGRARRVGAFVSKRTMPGEVVGRAPDSALPDDQLEDTVGKPTGRESCEQAAEASAEAAEVEHVRRTFNSSPEGGEEEEEGDEDLPTGTAKPGNTELAKKRLKQMQEAHKRRGILYISRIPPHMKPQKLRHMLSEYGEIGRLYLAPEDPLARKRRKKAGGNTGKNFVEGWVEFEDKAVAKRVAALLNGQQMGGRRRSAYHYDLWTLKYLPKFKWDHLTEEIAYQKAVREQRLAAEISAAKRDRDFFLSRVDKAKAVAAQEARKRKRAEAAAAAPPADAGAAGSALPQGAATDAAGAGASGGAPAAKILRTYGQRRPKADARSETAPVLAPDVLALIGGRGLGA